MLDSDNSVEVIPINSLLERDDIINFQCGTDSIDNFLINNAEEFDSKGNVKTFLYYENGQLIGFFSVCTSEASLKKFYKKKAYFRNPKLTVYPAITLVYFAIRKDKQRMGKGTVMMQFLFEFLYEKIYMHVGFCLLTLETKEESREFYMKLGFESYSSYNNKTKNLAVTINDIEYVIGC